MPATNRDLTDLTDLDSKRQRQSALRDKAKAVQQSGESARINREDETRKRRARHRYEDANPEYAKLRALDFVEALIAVLFPGAAYILDLSIFSATADFFARLAAPGSPAVALGMRLAIPLIVLAADIWIGLGFWHARDKALRDPQTYLMYRRWAFGACLFVLLMPVFASASAFAAVMAAHQPGIRELLAGQGIGTAILALVVHGGIILGAQRIERAWGFFVYRRRHALLEADEIVSRDAAVLNESECWGHFQDYYADLKAFNNDFDEISSPGPFDKSTTDLINERIGWKVVNAEAETETESGDERVST